MSFNFVNNQHFFRWHRPNVNRKWPKIWRLCVKFQMIHGDFMLINPYFMVKQKLLSSARATRLAWREGDMNASHPYLAQVTVCPLSLRLATRTLPNRRRERREKDESTNFWCDNFLSYFIIILTLMLFHEILIWLFNPTQLRVISDFLSPSSLEAI